METAEIARTVAELVTCGALWVVMWSILRGIRKLNRGRDDPARPEIHHFYVDNATKMPWATIKKIMGRVNSTKWRGHYPGTMMFTNFNAEPASDTGGWNIEYVFSEKATFTGTTIQGWGYGGSDNPYWPYEGTPDFDKLFIVTEPDPEETTEQEQ